MAIPSKATVAQSVAGPANIPSSAAPAATPAKDPVEFRPPYLRYNNPDDLKKINAAIAAAEKQALKTAKASAILGGATRIDARALGGIRSDIEAVGPAPSAPASGARAVVPAAAPDASAAKTATGTLSVVPGGTVNLGFWCDTSFKASSPHEGQFYVWKLTLDGGDVYHLGITWFNASIHFVLDGETYKLSAYYGKGTAALRVYCECWNPAAWAKFSSMSDDVYLKFSQSTPCLHLHSVSLNAGSVKGGDQNDSFAITVALDGPAPPGGQVVLLKTDNNKTSILGSGSFIIPEGKTSEPFSWFLGSKKVLKNQDVMITAAVNGSEGYAHFTLTK